ncbi:ArsR/SmtB family transcription factor [Isobaculum melis]|uniref:ArsR/SmtB family transcription factor n=1 Tax=Isobaculum melis TaxID=142588 RepID=UPI000AD94ADF|nr:helix-turn-helix domain-containing protein [Isobaculum melis]
MKIDKTFINTDNDEKYDMNLLQVLQALSDPIRLDIVLCLLDEKRGCLLKERYPIVKSTMSHHLKTLREADIILLHKERNKYKYEVNIDGLNQHFPGLIELLKNQIMK